MIEVFKTNIVKKREARMILKQLLNMLPGVAVNFDLEDCDRILRIESRSQYFDARQVCDIVTKMGFECLVLND